MRILIVGEDSLSCAVGERMVAAALPSWTLAAPSIDKKGVTKLRADLPRYFRLAHHMDPVFCLADTDGACVVDLLNDWLPTGPAPAFLLRFAVSEIESWVLADRIGFAASLQVPPGRIPRNTDEISDPKRFVLTMISKSKRRQLRQEMISATDPAKPGSGYNAHLRDFVYSAWDVERACESSPSLTRAFGRLRALTVLHSAR